MSLRDVEINFRLSGSTFLKDHKTRDITGEPVCAHGSSLWTEKTNHLKGSIFFSRDLMTPNVGQPKISPKKYGWSFTPNAETASVGQQMLGSLIDGTKIWLTQRHLGLSPLRVFHGHFFLFPSPRLYRKLYAISTGRRHDDLLHEDAHTWGT